MLKGALVLVQAILAGASETEVESANLVTQTMLASVSPWVGILILKRVVRDRFWDWLSQVCELNNARDVLLLLEMSDIVAS